MEIRNIINWQKGNPTEYGSYLVLHRNHLGRLVIDHDIWFDDSQRWQSQWRDIVAWCAFSDIDVKEKSFSKDEDYWTRLEHQYAGMAMQGMLNNSYLAGEFRKDPNNGIKDMSNIITKAAAVYAHALAEKMKEVK